MLTFVDVKFTSIVHVKKIKGCCSGLQIHCIFQTADVIRQVVFLLCFQTIVRRETSKMFHRLFGHFSFHNQNYSTSRQVFSVNGALTCNCHDVIG